MSSLNEAVVSEALRWIGTPYRHQASRLGAGCDCLGLVRGVWRGLYGDEPETPPAYSSDWSEPGGQERLWQAALKHLEPSPASLAKGHILLFRMRDGSVAKHLGIVCKDGPDAAFIHAYSGRGVVQSYLTQPWCKRVVAEFRFPQRGF